MPIILREGFKLFDGRFPDGPRSDNSSYFRWQLKEGKQLRQNGIAVMTCKVVSCPEAVELHIGRS